MLQKILMQITAAAALLICLGTTLRADYDSDIDLNNGVLSVTTDDSDDIVHISKEGNDIVVRVFQFHANEQKYNVLQFILWANDFNEIEDLAEDSRDRDEDYDDVVRIEIETFGGNDLIEVAEGVDCMVSIWSGDDRDGMFIENASRTYLYGQNGDDIINGSNTGSNRIFGGEGRDNLMGGDQNDFIFGGEGRDYIWGYGGDDDLYGDAGGDTIRGGEGNDYLEGGYDGDLDRLYGDEGFDEVVGFYFQYIDPRNPNKNWVRRLETEWIYEGEIILGIVK